MKIVLASGLLYSTAALVAANMNGGGGGGSNSNANSSGSDGTGISENACPFANGRYCLNETYIVDCENYIGIPGSCSDALKNLSGHENDGLDGFCHQPDDKHKDASCGKGNMAYPNGEKPYVIKRNVRRDDEQDKQQDKQQDDDQKESPDNTRFIAPGVAEVPGLVVQKRQDDDHKEAPDNTRFIAPGVSEMPGPVMQKRQDDLEEGLDKTQIGSGVAALEELGKRQTSDFLPDLTDGVDLESGVPVDNRTPKANGETKRSIEDEESYPHQKEEDKDGKQDDGDGAHDGKENMGIAARVDDGWFGLAALLMASVVLL